MKKNINKYLYLFPFLIILGMFVSLNFSMADADYKHSSLEVFKSKAEGLLNNTETNLELAKEVTVSTVSPPPAVKPAVKTLSIPILMYHEIGDGPSSLYVSVNNFRAQMHYLRTNGYNVVTMTQAQEMLAANHIPAKTVVITFDDGYVSVYNRAWPILQEYSFPATVYVCSGFPGLYNYLTWDNIMVLQSGGIEIGSHSHTHPVLTTVSPAALTQEIAGSKQILEQKLGTKINSFCYPTGAYNEQTPKVIKSAGYTSAVTINFRRATPKDDLYLLPRIRVFKADTIASFTRNIQ